MEGINYYVMTALAIVTGGRPVQIATLTWKQVNFEEKCIILPIAKAGDTPVIDTGNVPEEVMSFDELLTLLMHFKRKSTGEIFVFPGGEKGHIAKSTWKNWINRIKEACRSSDFYGLKDFQWKDLRSSAATDLYDQKRDPYAVARFLGDKSFDVVQKYIQGPWEQKLRWLKTPEGIKWQQERNKGVGEGKIENEKVKAITPDVVPVASNINIGLSVVVQLNELARNLERGYITPEEFTWFKRNLYNNIAGNYP